MYVVSIEWILKWLIVRLLINSIFNICPDTKYLADSSCQIEFHRFGALNDNKNNKKDEKKIDMSW